MKKNNFNKSLFGVRVKINLDFYFGSKVPSFFYNKIRIGHKDILWNELYHLISFEIMEKINEKN